MDQLTKLLEAEGWTLHGPNVWRYYAGVEVYEIQLHVAGGAVLHASFWDLTGARELLATAYRAWPTGVKRAEITAWVKDPAAQAAGGPR